MAVAETASEEILAWCTSVVGPYKIVTGMQRPDGRSSTSCLKSASGHSWLKVHDRSALWEQEVHGYERWTAAFDGEVPPLLAVRDKRPLALMIGELPGNVLENMKLSLEQEQTIWRTAGQRLPQLHGHAEGEFFGPCRRDETPLGEALTDAVDYVGLKEEQRLVGHALYALNAITWGMQASYFGFVDEGRRALRHLAPQLS